MPVKLSTRARIFAIGHGGKNDPAAARTVAVVALRTPGLHEVGMEDETAALRLLSDCRTELVARRAATVNRLHQLLAELIPSGAGKDLTAKAAKPCSRPSVPGTLPVGPAGRWRWSSSPTSPAPTLRSPRSTPSSPRWVAATGTSLTDIHQGRGRGDGRADPRGGR